MYTKEKAKINHYEDIVSDMIRTLREQQEEKQLERERSVAVIRARCPAEKCSVWITVSFHI